MLNMSKGSQQWKINNGYDDAAHKNSKQEKEQQKQQQGK